MIIHRADLTADEFRAISERHWPYDNFAEFWTGFADYQCDCNRRNRWPNSDAGAAWDRGTEAAMRIHWERHRCGYARDDLDSRKMCAGLDSAIKKLRAKAAKEGLTLEDWFRRERQERRAAEARRKVERFERVLPLVSTDMTSGANDNGLAH